VEAVGEGDRLLELFAGAGFFTLALARRFTRVVAVESNPRAAEDLRRNAADAGLRGVEVRERRVERADSLRDTGRPDAALLDPPRTGVSRAVLDALVTLAPSKVVYLSCDPATLSRDLRLLLQRGHRLRRVEAFDLFPQTPHVEVLAVLEREGG
jgi:23S rRNA (uracil1939-C5)-methyltransferase